MKSIKYYRPIGFSDINDTLAYGFESHYDIKSNHFFQSWQYIVNRQSKKCSYCLRWYGTPCNIYNDIRV